MIFFFFFNFLLLNVIVALNIFILVCICFQILLFIFIFIIFNINFYYLIVHLNSCVFDEIKVFEKCYNSGVSQMISIFVIKCFFNFFAICTLLINVFDGYFDYILFVYLYLFFLYIFFALIIKYTCLNNFAFF